MESAGKAESPPPGPRAFIPGALVALLALLLVFGCGKEETKAAYTILGVQDYSHGRVGRFSARVAVSPELPREMVRHVVKDVVSQVVESHRADVCWVLVHNAQPPTMKNLIASAQWISPALPPEDKPYVEVSEDAVPYQGATIYITWQ